MIFYYIETYIQIAVHHVYIYIYMFATTFYTRLLMSSSHVSDGLRLFSILGEAVNLPWSTVRGVNGLARRWPLARNPR